MSMKKYQKDLTCESKVWKPYLECSEREYRNQKFRIQQAILNLIEDKCIFSLISNNNVALEQEMLMSSYQNRCSEDKTQQMIEHINQSLVNYKGGDLEDFITRQIPGVYLNSFDALNLLGLEWVKKEHSLYAQYKAEASKYIFELCWKRYKNLDSEVVDALVSRMIKELDTYQPELQKLGEFISSRMGNRLIDIQRKRIGLQHRKRKIPQKGIIQIRPIMLEDTISVVSMEKVASQKDLKIGTYVIQGDKIYFSSEDIGKTVCIKYKEDLKVKEQQVQEKYELQKEKSMKEEDEQERVKLIAKVLNYEEVYTGKNKVEEKQRERNRICFTEKLAYCVKKGEIEDATLEIDASKVVHKKYLNFFMSQSWDSGFLFQLLKQVPLKCMSDILSSEEKKELKWNKKGWLSSKVPMCYFDKMEQTKLANSTISEFRKAYEDNTWLKKILCNM